jgi:hypothetical protein
MPGDPPEGSKHAKALAWLRRVNKDDTVKEPLRVFGRIIENCMERPVDPSNTWDEPLVKARVRLATVLKEHGLRYCVGGRIESVTSLGVPTRTLQEFIRERDLAAIDHEFERAAENVDTAPCEAAPRIEPAADCPASPSQSIALFSLRPMRP